MNELFLPEELIIIGASLYFNKHKITNDEINEYMRKINFRIEYSDEEYKFCEYRRNVWKINRIPKLHPYIHSILTNI